jgi:selenocysteine lyase/cysteine desulfurase
MAARQTLAMTEAPPAITDALADLRAEFAPVPGYLDAATMGLPPARMLRALRVALDTWEAGRSRAVGFDAAVERARAAYARIVDVPAGAVAVGSQASVFGGLVASSLPDGASVLTVHGDFTSVVFPFLAQADRGVTVRQVPLEALADEVRPSTSLVAYSLVQSADGRIADAASVREAARRVGALTFCDTTQAVGWLPVTAEEDDVTVCSAYKWLCAPRGTAFLTVRPEVIDRLRPSTAGWYAGADVWSSVYGPEMRLAADARRFDVSPAWHAWVGAAEALELFAGVEIAEVHRHDAALADAFRERIGLGPADRAVVSLPDPDGARRAALLAAGCAVAGRAGMVRVAFHVWNDAADVERAAGALKGQPPMATRTAVVSCP